MARQNATDDATGAEPTNEQTEYVKQIDAIVVDPDEVVTHFSKNKHISPANYNQRSFKLCGMRSGVPEAKPKRDPRDDGCWYPESPHPVWIKPKGFIEGTSRGDDAELPRMPDHSELIREFKLQYAGEIADHRNDWTDEQQAEFDEFRDVAFENWRGLVRRNLKEEYTFEKRTVNHRTGEEKRHDHTVSIEYDD
jgi:hypothetical protein